MWVPVWLESFVGFFRGSNFVFFLILGRGKLLCLFFMRGKKSNFGGELGYGESRCKLQLEFIFGCLCGEYEV